MVVSATTADSGPLCVENATCFVRSLLAGNGPFPIQVSPVSLICNATPSTDTPETCAAGRSSPAASMKYTMKSPWEEMVSSVCRPFFVVPDPRYFGKLVVDEDDGGAPPV